jgi:hypothetical protein
MITANHTNCSRTEVSIHTEEFVVLAVPRTEYAETKPIADNKSATLASIT